MKVFNGTSWSKMAEEIAEQAKKAGEEVVEFGSEIWP